MAVNEIIIRQAELMAAIATMNALKIGTQYRYMNPETALMSTSISQTSDAVTEMFRTMQQTEGVLLELVEKTIQAMETAGVSFEQADIAAGQGFKDLPSTLIM